MSITLQNVSKAYGSQPVVRDVSLTIETGELFVLLGSSGSGKSTLLRLVAGLLDVDSGTIHLNDRDVTRIPAQQRGTGFVFQNYSLFRHMTVAQNIAFGLEIRNTPRSVRQARVDELLDLISLNGYGNRYPQHLSGGQQQRVALARALAYEPNVLLLDEPFGALDVKIRAQLRQNLREIQQRLHVTTILVTHDQEEAFEVADRIGIIEAGQLIEVGTPSELYRHPRTRFTATFLGTANLLSAHRNGRYVHVANTQLPAPDGTEYLSGQDVELLCRPEELALFRSREHASGNVLGCGVVRHIAFAGHVQRVTVQYASSKLEVLLTPTEVRELDLTVGQEVWVSVKEFHLLPV
jgi:sulfate/thiosulfate transport system ATP-binding protein